MGVIMLKDFCWSLNHEDNVEGLIWPLIIGGFPWSWGSPKMDGL